MENFLDPNSPDYSSPLKIAKRDRSNFSKKNVSPTRMLDIGGTVESLILVSPGRKNLTKKEKSTRIVEDVDTLFNQYEALLNKFNEINDHNKFLVKKVMKLEKYVEEIDSEKSKIAETLGELLTDTTQNENKLDKVEESVKSVNSTLSSFKKNNKANETIGAGLKKQILEIQKIVDNLQSVISSKGTEDPGSYANIVRNGNGIQKITEKVIAESKIRSVKELNIIITGIEPDNLTEGTTLETKVYELIAMIDTNAEISNTFRLFSKKDKKFTDKVVVTLSSKETRDGIIKLSKSILKGRSIFINPDLTPMEMEVEFKLRQEKKVLSSKLSDDEKLITSYYIRNSSIFSYNNVSKKHELVKSV
jgi:hypothetical protein